MYIYIYIYHLYVFFLLRIEKHICGTKECGFSCYSGWDSCTVGSDIRKSSNLGQYVTHMLHGAGRFTYKTRSFLV